MTSPDFPIDHRLVIGNDSTGRGPANLSFELHALLKLIIHFRAEGLIAALGLGLGEYSAMSACLRIVWTKLPSCAASGYLLSACHDGDANANGDIQRQGGKVNWLWISLTIR